MVVVHIYVRMYILIQLATWRQDGGPAAAETRGCARSRRDSETTHNVTQFSIYRSSRQRHWNIFQELFQNKNKNTILLSVTKQGHTGPLALVQGQYVPVRYVPVRSIPVRYVPIRHIPAFLRTFHQSMGWWSSVGCDYFRGETYRDVKA
jgi:hypothetical protein